ncbi:MAG: penicillin-insensitive murein endopeptidase [Solirubrobacteraceae bacterium]
MLAVLVLAAIAAGGCGDDPLPRTRVLQVDPSAFIAQQVAAEPRRAAPVRASLTAATGPVTPPPIQVPDVGSVAIGVPNAGSLANGLQLPVTGPDWITWDPVTHSSPNRPDRRWATDRLLAFLIGVLRDYRLANPSAPPVLVGDLSRPGGGRFGNEYGGLGHASHQNGLDVDVIYPRADRALRPPDRPRDVDRALAQDLVSRFVAAGARFAFVGLRVGLGGPPGVVQAIPHHDDHVHVRIPNARG